MKKISLGLNEALQLALANVPAPVSVEKVSLTDCVERVAASDLFALVDSPSADVSLKDGYAISAHEVADATTGKAVRLQLLGSIPAGGDRDIQVKPGTTVRVLTGARIPTGADAVVAEEFAEQQAADVLITVPVEPGRNILTRGSDVSPGKPILQPGHQISPGRAGLIAAAGHTTVPVFRNPVVGVIGTGNELVEPGKPMAAGKLYASNIVTLAGWCNRYRIQARTLIVGDDRHATYDALRGLSGETDAILTSGGAWTGDHDLVARVLEDLGWKEIFHRIRIGPGKGTGFGILNNKPLFILPGGPSSNLMGFLQIALPCLLAMSGHSSPALPRMNALLASELRGRETGWTDLFFGTLEFNGGLPSFRPLKKRSRLFSIAEATAIASIPEGKDSLPAGAVVSVQLLK